MLSPSALVKGLVARCLPTTNIDSQAIDVSTRLGRYGEQYTLPTIRKSHVLADEGSYFITHNAQTAIITSNLGTAFSQTTIGPVLCITNTDNVGGKSIYLDYLNLIATVVGAAASNLTLLNFAWSLDTINNRYTSGGTDLTSVPAAGGGSINPNTGIARRTSIAQINFGALTLAAASVGARIIVPQRQLRQINSATVMCAVQDNFNMIFGAVENYASEVDLSTAKTVALQKMFNLPPLIIAPGHCAVLHMWSPGAAITTGITFLPEMGHFER